MQSRHLDQPRPPVPPRRQQPQQVRNPQNNRTYRRALSDRIKADGHDQLATHVLRARMSTMPALTAAAGYDTKDIASVPVPGQSGNHRLQEADVKLITAVGKAFGHRRSEINQTLHDTDCIPVPNLSEARRSDKAVADRRRRVQEAKDAVTGGKPANHQRDTSRRNETSAAQKEKPTGSKPKPTIKARNADGKKPFVPDVEPKKTLPKPENGEAIRVMRQEQNGECKYVDFRDHLYSGGVNASEARAEWYEEPQDEEDLTTFSDECEYETQRELEAEWEASKYKRSKVRKEIKRITQGRRDAMNERFSQRTYQDSLSQTQMESVRIEFEQRAAAALKNPRELWRVGMFALPELEDVHRLPTTPTVDTEGEEQSESLF